MALRVFVDANVFVTASNSPSTGSANVVILRLAEAGLIEAVTSAQVVAECERVIRRKFPAALPAFHALLPASRTTVAANPAPGELAAFAGHADETDLVHLVVALREQCPFLVTHNVADFLPGHPDVTVCRPAEFVHLVRLYLAGLTAPHDE